LQNELETLSIETKKLLNKLKNTKNENLKLKTTINKLHESLIEKQQSVGEKSLLENTNID